MADKTSPKGTFTVVEWDYRPSTDAGEDLDRDYMGAFTLRVRLHPHENRWHLFRSLEAASRRWSTIRWIVIATVEEMLTPDALVRCAAVDSFPWNAEQDPPGWVTLQSAVGSRALERSACVRRSCAVPDDSIWLVVPVTNHRPPSSMWGHLNERFDASEALPGPWAIGSDETSRFEQRVQLAAQRDRRFALALWTLLGPGILLLTWLSFGPAAGVNAFFARNIASFFGVGADHVDPFLEAYWRSSALTFFLYLCIYAGLAGFAAVDFFSEGLRARSWRRREGQLRTASESAAPGALESRFVPGAAHNSPVGAVWKGGTRETLLATAMLQRGSPYG